MIKKCVAIYLVLAMFVIGVAPPVEAAFSPSEMTALTPLERAGDLQKIKAALETKVVRQRLQDLGFTSDEVTTRISELSTGQIHRLALTLDDMRVGQDTAGGIVIGLAIVAAIALVYIYASGRKIAITK